MPRPVPLLKHDLAVEPDLEPQRRDLQRHRRSKCLASGDRTCGDGIRNRLFDLALRTDADRLEKLANTEIEDFRLS